MQSRDQMIAVDWQLRPGAGINVPLLIGGAALSEKFTKNASGAKRCLADCLPKSVVDCLLVMDRIELLQGTLDMLILQTLQWGPQHGHGIGQAIRANSLDVLQIEHGSLYPALHRLEKRDWLQAEWRNSETNRRAKYYKLTAAGKKQLLHEQSKWKLLVKTVSRLMKPA